MKDASGEAGDGDDNRPRVSGSELTDIESTPKPPPKKKAKTKAEKAEEKATGLRNAIQATRATVKTSVSADGRDAPDASKDAVRRDRDTSQASASAAAAATSKSS